MKSAIVIQIFLWCFTFNREAQSQGALPPPEQEPSKQFDFWIGEWDVNLRMLEEGNWNDRVKARATIYSILDGKAVMELWDSPKIKGFSLRYYDPKIEKWILWLNWPSINNSKWNKLTGAFRHGRGEFNVSYVDKGDTVIARYTFSDITKNSLRWDDGYSRDGGKSWSSNWIMEFSRVTDQAPWSAAGEPLNTFEDGSLCPNPKYSYFDKLLSIRKATDQKQEVKIESHAILNGCAIITLITTDNESLFMMSTFNVVRGRHAIYCLSDQPGEGVINYFWEESQKCFLSEDKNRKIELDLESKPYISFYDKKAGKYQIIRKLEF